MLTADYRVVFGGQGQSRVNTVVSVERLDKAIQSVEQAKIDVQGFLHGIDIAVQAELV